tara:strand:- start:10641 stop:10913 length:273 start_codon:yes stop_codon:yes gene_type:complete
MSKRKIEDLSTILDSLNINSKKPKYATTFYKNVFNTNTILVKSSYSYEDVCSILNTHDDELEAKFIKFIKENNENISIYKEESNSVTKVK